MFYVGKGRRDRAWSLQGRNIYWRRVNSKHGFAVTICAYWDSEDEAHQHEIFLIKCFRDMGTPLTNMTDGGEGMSGYTPSPESNMKRSESLKAFLSDPSEKSKRISHLASIYSDEVVQRRRKEAIRAALSSPLVKKKLSAHTSNRWSDSEYKKNTSKAMADAHARPEVKMKVLATKRRGLENNKSRSVVCLDTKIVFPITGDAVRWLRDLGFSKATEASICVVCQGKRKSCYGYRWEYYDSPQRNSG